MEENNVLTDTEELKILSDLVAIKSVNDNEILVAKYLQKLLGERNENMELVHVCWNIPQLAQIYLLKSEQAIPF